MEERYGGREHEKVRMQVWHLGREKGKRGRLAQKSFRLQRSQWGILVPESPAAKSYISPERASLRKPTTDKEEPVGNVSCSSSGGPTGQR